MTLDMQFLVTLLPVKLYFLKKSGYNYIDVSIHRRYVPRVVKLTPRHHHGSAQRMKEKFILKANHCG